MDGGDSLEIFESMHVYTWGQPVYVAFIDILGFQAALDSASDAQDLTFGLWRNCLPLRSTLSGGVGSDPARKLNFVQMTDALVIYGDDEARVVDLVCNVFGSAVVWGVPIRGGLGYGVVNHAEDKGRPGTIISFYGGGLTDAYRAEQSGRGRGMRLFCSDEYLLRSSQEQARLIAGRLLEYPWWLRCGLHSADFRERSRAWWKTKTVGKWFSGGQREDTKHVFERAVAELRVSEQV